MPQPKNWMKEEPVHTHRELFKRDTYTVSDVHRYIHLVTEGSTVSIGDGAYPDIAAIRKAREDFLANVPEPKEKHRKILEKLLAQHGVSVVLHAIDMIVENRSIKNAFDFDPEDLWSYCGDAAVYSQKLISNG